MSPSPSPSPSPPLDPRANPTRHPYGPTPLSVLRSRTNIAGYEYANYALFKAAFLAQAAGPRRTGTGTGTGAHISGHSSGRSLPSITVQAPGTATQIVNGISLQSIYDAVNHDVFNDYLVDASGNRVSGSRVGPGTKRVTKVDLRLLEDLNKQLLTLHEYAKKNSMVSLPFIQNAVDVLKRIAVKNGFATTSRTNKKTGITTNNIPVTAEAIRSQFARYFGHIMEDIVARGLPSASSIAQSFTDAALSKAIPNTGIRGGLSYTPTNAAGVNKGGFPTINLTSSTPLVDVRSHFSGQGEFANLNIAISVKSSFSPTAKNLTVFRGDWRRLLVPVFQRVREKTRWGLFRLLTYADRIPPEIQNQIILSNIDDLIGGAGQDRADYLVYNGTFYPIAAIVDAVAKYLSTNLYMRTGFIEGALTGMALGKTEFKPGTDRWRRILGLRKRHNLPVTSILDQAIVTYTEQREISAKQLQFSVPKALALLG